jgi:hypothetical protein
VFGPGVESLDRFAPGSSVAAGRASGDLREAVEGLDV